MVVLSQEDEIRERLFPEWDMEWVEAADIREVLNDALEQSADDKQKRMLSQMWLEIESGGLSQPMRVGQLPKHLTQTLAPTRA